MSILRLKEVMALTGLGRSTIYKLHAEGKFPQSIPLSDRAVGWYSSEVESWIRYRMEQRGTLSFPRAASAAGRQPFSY